MPKLAELQSAFIDALRKPEMPVPDAIREKDGEPAKRRFDVYRNNVVAGMTDALRATYPAVEKLVGAEFFAASVRVFLDRHPPRSPLLFRYGESFGDFLDAFPPAASTAYIGDVARLEWARLQAYHAEDADPLAVDALGAFLENHAGEEGIDVGKLGFTLHPSVALIRSRFPIVSLWAASTGQASSEDVDMKRSERALVIRPALSVETRQLPESSFAFMSMLQDGASLEQAAAAAAVDAEDFDLTVQLQGLFAVGAVSAINGSSL